MTSLLSCHQESETAVNENITDDKEIMETSEFSVSMINLIANPEKYHGKKIQVVGYLCLEFEGNAIYLHREDYDNLVFNNGLWISVDINQEKKIISDNLNKSYVLIEGTFNMYKKGHMGMWSGQIEEITRFIKWN